MVKRYWFFTLMLSLIPLAAFAVPPVTTGSLLDEMVDMASMADFPAPFYKTVQFSSYDHRSVSPDKADWFGNSDGFGGDPTPNFEAVLKNPGSDGIGEYLICDVTGPGAIVREWTAAIEGNIRMYLDNAEKPVFDGPANQFFSRAFDYYPQAESLKSLFPASLYQKNSAYCPIPFAKKCTVIWIGDIKRIHFYHLQVRLYEKTADVVTFTPGDFSRYESNFKRTCGIMLAPDTKWEYRSKETPVKFEITVPADKIGEAVTLRKGNAVERLVLKVDSDNVNNALRQTVMHVFCDGAPTAQVQSPVGDFFGAAPGINPYSSVPFSVFPDGKMVSRFVMPYSDSLKIVFENMGDRPVKIQGELLPMDYAWNDNTSMYFRARWRIDQGLVSPIGAVQDLPYIIANGKGLYVGSAAYILNIGAGPHPGGSWWGEGDEKIYTDGDIFPSTFGTGSEDYYNYAWSDPTLFQFPYCAQPRNDGPANRGFTTNNRWQILDRLPFGSRISFYMEYFPHAATRDNAYSRIGYHYGAPGMTDDHVRIKREDVRVQQLPALWKPEPIGWASNSVFPEAEKCTKGKVKSRMDKGAIWSGGSLYRWIPKAKGEKLELSFNVDSDGSYSINPCFAMDKDSGSVSMTIDGKNSGIGGNDGIAKLFEPYQIQSRCFETSAVDLKKGIHSVTLCYEGDTDKTVGIDFLWIKKR